MIVNDDDILKSKIYHKPTHADQYMNWDSNHHLEYKRSIVCTLLCRTETVVSKPQNVMEKVKHEEHADSQWIQEVVFSDPLEGSKGRGPADRRSYCQQVPCVHPLHLWSVRTVAESIQVYWYTIIPQTFQHSTSKVPVGQPQRQLKQGKTVWGGI